MIKLPLSFGRWNKLKNVLDFSESSIKSSCIGELTLRLKGCIDDIFSKSCCEEVSQIQKAGLEWSIYARHFREVSLNGLPNWITGIFVFFQELLWGITKRKESIKLYIEALIIV